MIKGIITTGVALWALSQVPTMMGHSDLKTAVADMLHGNGIVSTAHAERQKSEVTNRRRGSGTQESEGSSQQEDINQNDLTVIAHAPRIRAALAAPTIEDNKLVISRDTCAVYPDLSGCKNI